MKANLSLVLLLGAAGVLIADTPERASKPKSVDEKFVMGARSGGQFEIQSGTLALQRATDPEVKKFAQMLIDDHKMLGAELDRVARSTVSSATSLNPIHAAMLSKLSSEQGKDFDECFIGMQVLAHEEALMCFRKEAKKGENADLKSFAERSIPKLKEHLQMARKMCDAAINDSHHESLKPKTDGR